jgi:beta-glucosidase
MTGPAGHAFGKMHGNRALVTGVLKDRLAFDGLVVSDWNAIEQVPGCTTDHCPAAINAGIDVFMVPDKWKSFIANTVADVREGRVAEARIDDAVTRILRVKLRQGLFERPISAGRYTGVAAALVDRPLAQEAVRRSAVLLKNDAALPLKPGKRILVVGAAADSFPAQAGGWSITWQGDQTDNADYPIGETILGGLRRVYGAGSVTYSPDGSGFDKTRFDAVIAVLAEKPHAEMKGDVRWPEPLAQSRQYPEQAALLDRVAGQGVPVISVLYSGRTSYATDLINRSDAFVAAFLPGTEAGALADLLAGAGKRDFSARLSFAWPATACPSGGEPRGETLFARGFGLTYARPVKTGRLAERTIPAVCP